MIIEGEVSDGIRYIPVMSTWTHTPDDPWAVKVLFEVGFSEQKVSWNFSLDLLMEAFTSPSEGLQGPGNVLIEVGENFSFIHLSNGRESGTVKFSTADILKFLNQVGLQDSEEVIARELDEFLGEL